MTYATNLVASFKAQEAARLCVCGHTNGQHVQNRLTPTGGCLADTGPYVCGCELFLNAFLEEGR